MSLIEQLQEKQWIKDLPLTINAYIVGGCVRDLYLNRKSKDIDIVLENTNFDFISNYLSQYGKVDIVGESFGVIKFKPFNEQFDYDIALTRSERKIDSGHKGFDVSVDNISIEDDLCRRDFTINSIAINIKTNKILDIFNSRQAIDQKLIIVNKEESFFEDPLRMLRAVQFALRFNFEIEQNTLDLIKKNASLIKEISPERILIEFEKVRCSKISPNKLINLLIKTDLYQYIFNTRYRWYSEIYEYNSYNNSITAIDKQSFYFMLFHNMPAGSASSLYKEILKGDNATFIDIKAIESLWYIDFDKIDDAIILLNIYKAIRKYNKLISANTWHIFRSNKTETSLKILHYLNLFITNYFPNPLNPFINGDEIMKICNIDKPSKLISDLFDKILIDIFNEEYSEKDYNIIKTKLIKYYLYEQKQ